MKATTEQHLWTGHFGPPEKTLTESLKKQPKMDSPPKMTVIYLYHNSPTSPIGGQTCHPTLSVNINTGGLYGSGSFSNGANHCWLAVSIPLKNISHLG